MMQEHTEWTDDEREQLNAFGEHEEPGEMLRARTLRALRQQGTVRPPVRRSVHPAIGIAAAVALIAGAYAYLAPGLRSDATATQKLADSATSAPTTNPTSASVQRSVIWF